MLRYGFRVLARAQRDRTERGVHFCSLFFIFYFSLGLNSAKKEGGVSFLRRRLSIKTICRQEPDQFLLES